MSFAGYDMLLVDADRRHALLLRQWLERSPLGVFRTVHAASFAAARGRVARSLYDVALLDLALPDCPGLPAVIGLLEAAPELPILVLSDVADERLALEAVLSGAQDYLIKWQSDASLVRRAVRHAIERKRVERELRRLARYDALTGLPNRTLFHDRLAQALGRIERHQRRVGLIFIDLDGFKVINDRHGHEVGDRLLAALAHRLCGAVRRTDTVARLGGDEFTIIVEGLQHEADAARVACKVLATLREPFELGDQLIGLGASLGIAIASDPGLPPARLIRQADQAMYRAKAEGGAGYRFFAPPEAQPAPPWAARLSA